MSIKQHFDIFSYRKYQPDYNFARLKIIVTISGKTDRFPCGHATLFFIGILICYGTTGIKMISAETSGLR